MFIVAGLVSLKNDVVIWFLHIVAISISSTCNLDTKVNKCFDITLRLHDAGLLTKCYTPHPIRPYMNTNRHFIEFQFVNKGIEYVNTQYV